MAFALNRFSAGDTTYISKHNSDATVIEAAINALLNATSIGIGTGGTTTANAWNDIYDRNGLIGASSFIVTCATSQTLSVTSGSVWMLPGQTRGQATSAVTLTFATRASGIFAILADPNGGLTVSTLSATVAGSNLQIYSIQYNAPNFGSAERLVQILFHGDDYNRMLSSPTFGSFTRVADRLSALENALTVDVLYAQSFVSATSWSYKTGHLRNNNAIVSTAAGTLALAASATHYVEVAISTGTVSYTTGGWTSSEAIALRKIVTSNSLVISNEDVRTWATAGGTGGAGVPGLANSGTTDGAWYLYRATGATSALPSTAAIVVDRGSLTDVAIRWNQPSSYWEYTENGTSYIQFGTLRGVSLDSTAATLFTFVASAPAILVATLSNTVSTVLLALSAYVATSTIGVFLRGTAFDSAGSVLISGEPFGGVAFYRDSGTVTAGAIAKIVAQTNSTLPEWPQNVWVPVSNQKIEYQAWAASQASLRCSVYLVGYLTTGGISAIDAKADGSTKGLATFLAADFNDNSAGLIQLDYANAQKATSTTIGFLTSADWLVFATGGTSGLVNPMTATGDMIYASGGATAVRVSIGPSGYRLMVSGGIPTWKLTDSVSNPFTTAGDLIYSSGTSSPARVSVGTSGMVLTVSGGVPVWKAAAGVTEFLSATVLSLTASVGANAYVLSAGQFSGAMNRGLIVYLETSGTIGVASTYDVELYTSNGTATSQLLMQALAIDASAAYFTRVPIAYRDLNSGTNVFLRLSNMGASAGLFSFHWQAEKNA